MRPAAGARVIPGPGWPGVACFATTRAGGVSRPPYDGLNLALHVGDEPASVRRNRAILSESLPGEPCWLEQVHGIAVHDADPAPPGATPPQADAAVTTRRAQVLAVLTADCLPVVITDAQGVALAVAHAGWRGLAGGVLQAAAGAVRRRAPDGVALRAWIGPAIGPEAFEVGAEVPAAFAQLAPAGAFRPRPGHPGKWLGDLPAIAESVLRRAGVAQVAHSGLCTVADARFYSYRRDGRTGRFATLAWLQGVPPP